jgi:sulfofructose kinase
MSTAQRTIIYSDLGVTEPRPEEITEELIANARVLFVDHTVVEAGTCAIELAHARGIPVVGDIEREAVPRLAELMRRIDHLILSSDLARRLTGESEATAAVQALSGADRACCVVTAGERGCWYAERGSEVRHFPAFQVQVVDTTGCGDVFHGAYAACIARGESVSTAIRVATAAAGLKAAHPGGRTGIPDRATVDNFLKTSKVSDASEV